MNPTPFERWLMMEMLINPRRRIIGQRFAETKRQRINPPCSASPEVRAQRAVRKAAQQQKKARRKASRR